MASPTLLTFDAEGRAVAFDLWLDDLQLFLQCHSRDGLSLFDLTSGASTAPAADADSTVRSQWLTRNSAARLPVRSHLPATERVHFSQYKSAGTLYDAVVARYSSPATAALSRLMLPYLFPDLAAFATVTDLITHLRTSDTRYRAALPTELSLRLLLVRGAASARASTARELEEVVGAAVVAVEEEEGVGVGVVAEVGASVAAVAVEAAVAGGVEEAEAAAAKVEPAEAELCSRDPSSSSALVRPLRLSSFVSGVAIFDLDFDAILAAMYAVSISAEGDCYVCVPPDPGIEATALGASESAAPGTGESAPSGTASAQVFHTFTLDSGASRSFFRDRTTLTPLSRPVAVSLADPSGGSLSGLYLPSFSTNLVCGADLQDAGVDQFAPAGQRMTHCTCAQTGRHLATFTRRPGSSLYTLTTESPPVAASGQVVASSQVFAAASRSGPESAPCSCRLLSHQTLLWHHRLGHPSLPRLLGMASRVLVSGLPETSPTLRWTGKVGDASAFHVWGSRAFVRDLSADKLSSRAVPCVFLGFPPDAPGWQFYHPSSRRVLSSQDVTFDESVLYYRLFPYRTAPLPPPPLFLAPGPLPVDPLPPQGPAPSGVSQVDAVEPVEVAADSGASGGAEPGGAESGGAEPGGAESGGAEPGGAEPGGTGSGVAESEREEPGGAVSGGAEPGATGSGGVEPSGAGPGGPSDALSWRELPSPQELREWFARRWSRAAGAGGATATGGSATAGGTGAGGATGVSTSAGGTGAAGPGGAHPGGTGAAGPTGASRAGAGGAAGVSATGGTGAGAGVSAGGPAGPGAAGGAGAGGAAGVGADAWGAGVVPAGSGGAPRPRPYFIPLLEKVLGLPPSSGPTPSLECPPPFQSESQLLLASPLPAPSPFSGPTGGLAECREPESRPASPVRTARTSRRVPRSRPPPVPCTHQMVLRPSTAPQRVPLPSPPASSLPALLDPASDSLRAASPTVTRLLATVVNDPSFESTAASALVAESASVCPPSIGGEYALSTDVLEDRQEEFQCFAAAVPHLVSTLLAPEGDPDAPDIPTPRSYAEVIEGPYSSQWQAAMDAEMASRNSTGTYVDEVPPPGANIISGMWIFRVKRPSGSPPVFKARYVARCFSQRQGVYYFQTFSPTTKMTTLGVLLHIAAQRDYELHSLDFSTAFL
ncbi:unnamed protein product [Closterium sp. NIES-54]